MDSNQLESNLQQAIKLFDDKRVQILASAFQQGGRDSVTKLEQQYNALNDQYNKLIQTELDVNNAAYGNLSDQAYAETTKLKTSMTDLNDVNQTISLISSVVSLVASVVALV